MYIHVYNLLEYSSIYTVLVLLSSISTTNKNIQHHTVLIRPFPLAERAGRAHTTGSFSSKCRNCKVFETIGVCKNYLHFLTKARLVLYHSRDKNPLI